MRLAQPNDLSGSEWRIYEYMYVFGVGKSEGRGDCSVRKEYHLGFTVKKKYEIEKYT
jgi:hypothetical protein